MRLASQVRYYTYIHVQCIAAQSNLSLHKQIFVHMVGGRTAMESSKLSGSLTATFITCSSKLSKRCLRGANANQVVSVDAVSVSCHQQDVDQDAVAPYAKTYTRNVQTMIVKTLLRHSQCMTPFDTIITCFRRREYQ